MATKKLTYFNGRGRGELIRLVLSSQKDKFEDERLSFEQWGPKKPTMKYGQLPVLTLEDGKQMNESMAIAKYLARKAHLYGKDDWEIYLIDRAIDTMNDLFLKGTQAHFEKDEQKKEILSQELKEKFAPMYLGHLTKYIEESPGEFLAGDKPTLADIYLCCICDNFPDAKPHYPKLDNICKKVMTTFPGIKSYVESRPQTLF